MKAKKVSISIFLVLFIVFGAVFAIAYDRSASVKLLCFKDSYAEKYAKENGVDYDVIPDSEAYIGILNLENFEYNNDGTVVSYKGESEKIAIPTDIEGTKITKVAEKAFENAKNLKAVYIPKSVETFEPKEFEGVTVYMYKDTELYKTLSKDESVNFEIKTVSDSYFVDFYSADIPFSYNNISDKSIEINHYNAFNEIVFVPESIDGKIVTGISFDVLSDNIEMIIIPKTVTNIDSDLNRGRYDLTFLIGLLIAFVGALFAVIVVLSIKADTKERTFLGLSQFKCAYTVTVLSIILAAVYLFIAAVPEWVVYIAAVLIYGFAVINIIKARTAVYLVEGVDLKIKAQTQFIKSLTIDAQNLMNRANAPKLKEYCKKVYEALRYSDPMSNERLTDIENRIKEEFSVFTDAVISDDLDLTESSAKELINLIDERNLKCKEIKQ